MPFSRQIGTKLHGLSTALKPSFECLEEFDQVVTPWLDKTKHCLSTIKRTKLDRTAFAKLVGNQPSNSSQTSYYPPGGSTANASFPRFYVEAPAKFTVVGSFGRNGEPLFYASRPVVVDVHVELPHSMFSKDLSAELPNFTIWNKHTLATYYFCNHLNKSCCQEVDDLHSASDDEGESVLKFNIIRLNPLLSPLHAIELRLPNRNRRAQYIIKFVLTFPETLLTGVPESDNDSASSKKDKRSILRGLPEFYKNCIFRLCQQDMYSADKNESSEFSGALRLIKYWGHRTFSRSTSLITSFHLIILFRHLWHSKHRVMHSASVLQLVQMFFASFDTIFKGADIFGQIGDKSQTQQGQTYVLRDKQCKDYNYLWDLELGWEELRMRALEAHTMLTQAHTTAHWESMIDDLFKDQCASSPATFTDILLESEPLDLNWNIEEGSSHMHSIATQISHKLRIAFRDTLVNIVIRTDRNDEYSRLVLCLKLKDENLALEKYIFEGPSIEDDAACREFKNIWNDKVTETQAPDGRTVLCTRWLRPSFWAECPLNELSSGTSSAFTQALTWICHKTVGSKKLRIMSGWRLSDHSAALQFTPERSLTDEVATFRSLLGSLKRCSIRESLVNTANMRYTCDLVASSPCSRVTLLLILAGNTAAWSRESTEWVRMAKLGCLLTMQKEIMDKFKIRSSVINDTACALEVKHGSILYVLKVFTEAEKLVADTIEAGTTIRVVEDDIGFDHVEWWKVRHHRRVLALSAVHPSFPGAVKVLKHWARKNKIAWSFDVDEYWELLLMATYNKTIDAQVGKKTDTHSFLSSITTPNVAFWKVMNLIAKYPWSRKPLFCETLSIEDKTECIKSWSRLSLKPLTFLATSDDLMCKFVTIPTQIETRRLIKTAMTLVEKCSLHLFPPRELYVQAFGNVSTFDFILHLKNRDQVLAMVTRETKTVKNLVHEKSPLAVQLKQLSANNVHVTAEQLLEKVYDMLFNELRQTLVDHCGAYMFRDTSEHIANEIGIFLGPKMSKNDFQDYIKGLKGGWTVFVKDLCSGNNRHSEGILRNQKT